ncbi:MAG: MFS transporter [Corynebacterium sp.]|uniref:MFS transporter n=1 Tax=Corynebacterium TaxID=1716 RepID=UPI0026471119|nr:MFS transporter [Corynebacterium sp.]MDN5721793.1 MFS transporter [Corynebacterium sp.]MDN6283947.1 MFS transporter [Corynebacterium sp.]MDN6306044.1 MFS transporter [Corynebacterium sp.]MDN6368200.1 MFS transporter [Corynebacterium sp.]MDN6375778.1 MFS transporter [Corynebacterium sp.]
MTEAHQSTPDQTTGTTTPTSATSATTSPAIPMALLLTLGLLAAVAPFATDLYLPAMPQIADDLSTTVSGAQLSLTAFLIGTAVGQLFFGPWSDKAGRRVPLIIGSVATMMAYISALPFLYQKYMGLSTVQYGIAFAVNALALMVVSILSAKLTARFRFVRWPAPAWASTCSAPPSTASSAWWTPRR